MNTTTSAAPDAQRLDSSLSRYAVAASAALSATLGAEAAITNLTFAGGFTLSSSNSSGSFNFQQLGIEINFSGNRFFSSNPGFTFFTGPSSSIPIYSPGFSFYSGRISAEGANVAFFGGQSPINLALGDPFNGFGANNQLGTLIRTSAGGIGDGNFTYGAPGYLGFRANVGTQTVVGWLRIGIGLSGLSGLTPVSFNVIADSDGIVGAFAPLAEGINAGDVATPIPEPAAAAFGLGLLALGAAGLRRRRALASGNN